MRIEETSMTVVWITHEFAHNGDDIASIDHVCYGFTTTYPLRYPTCVKLRGHEYFAGPLFKN